MSQDSSAPDAAVVEEETTVVVGPSLLARLGAEAFGTFFLVLAILGVGLYGRFTGAGLVLPVALAGGIALLAAIAAVGHVSGGHFNPAVTLGAAIGGRTAWRDVLPYWLAQIVGGIIASLILFATLPNAALPILQQNAVIAEATKQSFMSGVANGFAEHSPLAASTSGAFSFEWLSAFLIEVVVTAIFVGVILGVTDKRSNSKLAPTAIGLSLAALLLIAAPFTNGSLNPARSIAAAIFSDSWALGQLWLFIVAPLAGAAIAALFYRAFAFAPVQDDLLAEDEVYVLDETTVSAEEPVVKAAGTAAVATEAEATETDTPQTPAADLGKDSTDDQDGTAPKA